MSTGARWIRLGRTQPHELRAACAGLASAQARDAAPIVVWGTGAEEFPFAVIAPRRLAPGRRSRWAAWAASPAIATYRHFGLPAYLEGGDICLHGRRIGRSEALALGDCALVVSGFVAQFPLALWGERALEAQFRTCLEAQHGWRFEHGWPSDAERAAIEDARAGQKEPA